MSSGRLFLDRVARLQSPSLLHRQCQDTAIASSGQKIYHRTVESVLTVCLTKQGNPILDLHIFGGNSGSPIFIDIAGLRPNGVIQLDD